jgi:hypothetical protein
MGKYDELKKRADRLYDDLFNDRLDASERGDLREALLITADLLRWTIEELDVLRDESQPGAANGTDASGPLHEGGQDA